jgi:hypothetical protein
MAERDQQEQEQTAKGQVREDNMTTKYFDARWKYNTNNNNALTLNSNEMYSLMKFYQRPDDYSVRKTVVERRQQFLRCEDRIKMGIRSTVPTGKIDNGIFNGTFLAPNDDNGASIFLLMISIVMKWRKKRMKQGVNEDLIDALFLLSSCTLNSKGTCSSTTSLNDHAIVHNDAHAKDKEVCTCTSTKCDQMDCLYNPSTVA